MRTTLTLDPYRVRAHAARLLPGIDRARLNALADEQEDAAANFTTDAQLAALAIEHQGEVHSNDSDFARFPQLRWVNPIA